MNADKAARQHFVVLSRDEKIQAICRMAVTGYADYSIAAATRLSVEMVRHILAMQVPQRRGGMAEARA